VVIINMPQTEWSGVYSPAPAVSVSVNPVNAPGRVVLTFTSGATFQQ
jgi:hypothetical protein